MKVKQWLPGLHFLDERTGLRHGPVRWPLGATPPFGCRWCGTEHGHHGRSWIRGHGMHGWEQPTEAQIKARMLARRNARKAVCRCLEPWEEPKPFAPVFDPWLCEAEPCRMHDYLIGGWLKPLTFDEAMSRLGGDA